MCACVEASDLQTKGSGTEFGGEFRRIYTFSTPKQQQIKTGTIAVHETKKKLTATTIIMAIMEITSK